MILILILILSFSSFLTSLLALTLVIRYLLKDDEEVETSPQDAILISGCDSGIGLELVKYFHRTCKFKIICGFLNPNLGEGFEKISSLIPRERITLIKLNITCNDDLDNLLTELSTLRESGYFKNLVGLINNAGTMTYGEFDWLTWDHIENQINVNIVGTIRLTRSVLPYLIESRGRIINVSSVNDSTVFPGLSIYSATKSAISTFSKGLGYELRKMGVKVITIRLGDFARLTNIMVKHRSNQDAMWKEMSSEKRNMYKDFFNEFNDHLMKNYGMTSPKNFEDSSLFKDFRKALLSKNPSSTITCAPITFKIFYFVIEMMPISIQYYLLDLLIRLGFKWNPPAIVIDR